MIDVESYEAVISQLESYKEKVNDGTSAMKTAATECVDATEGDEAVKVSKDNLDNAIKKIDAALSDIDKVVAAMKEQVRKAKEAAAKARAAAQSAGN